MGRVIIPAIVLPDICLYQNKIINQRCLSSVPAPGSNLTYPAVRRGRCIRFPHQDQVVMSDTTDSPIGEGNILPDFNYSDHGIQSFRDIEQPIQRRMDISWMRGQLKLDFWKNGHSVNWYEIYSPLEVFMVNHSEFQQFAFPAAKRRRWWWFS